MNVPIFSIKKRQLGRPLLARATSHRLSITQRMDAGEQINRSPLLRLSNAKPCSSVGLAISRLALTIESAMSPTAAAGAVLHFSSNDTSKADSLSLKQPAPRSCSLRSTQLTVSSASADSEPACFGEWVYWQRDCERNPQCWTKVFAVVLKDDASICLYECEDMSKRTLVYQRSMGCVAVEGNRRRIKLVDAQGGVILRLWLLNHTNHELWKSCLENAAHVAGLALARQQQLQTSSAWSLSSNSNTNQSLLSRTSLLSLRRQRANQSERVSKRAIVKAVCKDAISQIKSRIQGKDRA